MEYPDPLPGIIPVFPLKGVLLLPGGILPLNIFEPRYLNMFDDAMASHRMIGILQTADEDPVRPELERIGCLGQISECTETRDGRYLVSLSGICRFQVLEELDIPRPYRQIRIAYDAFLSDMDPDAGTDQDLADRLHETLLDYAALAEGEVDWASVRAVPAGVLLSSLCMSLPASRSEKQALLEAVNMAERLTIFRRLLMKIRAGD